MRFSQKSAWGCCSHLTVHSELRLLARSPVPCYWKEVTVFGHVNLSTVLPDCPNNMEVGLSGSEKARRMSQCFFWSSRRSQHSITVPYSYALEDSLKGEELSSTSCKQFMDRVHVARSHKRILNISSYLRFTNSIQESVNRGQTLKVSCIWVIPPLKWPTGALVIDIVVNRRGS